MSAGHAAAQIAGLQDRVAELEAEQARHAAVIEGIFASLQATAAAAGVAPPRPRLEIVR